MLDPGETIVVTLTGASTDGRGDVQHDRRDGDDHGRRDGDGVDRAGLVGRRARTLEFTVSLSGAVSSETVLGWSTSSGTAESGTDFTAVTEGTLRIAAEATSGTLVVSTSLDSLVELNETFTVTLAVIDGTPLPSGLTLGTASTQGTITNDDSLEASVTADPATTVAEGNCGEVFTVSLTGGDEHGAGGG